MVAICRLCASLKKSDTLTFIRDQNHDLFIKLAKCCQLKIDLNNILPRGVCPECVRNLNASFEFYDKVHESQISLEKLLNVQQKFKNENENSTSATEAEQLLEQQKSFNLVTAVTKIVSGVDGTHVEKEITKANTDTIDTLRSTELSTKGVYDESVSRTDEVDDIKKEHHSKEPICVEIKESVQDKNTVHNKETYEVLKPVEDVLDSKHRVQISADGCDFETAIEFVEDEDDFDLEEDDYEIIEVIEDNQEQGSRNVSNSPIFESEDVGFAEEEDDESSVSGLDGSNTSTWLEYFWKCVHCSVIFCTSQELVNHFEAEDKEPAWVCADCHKVFPKYYSLINHIRQRHRQQLGLFCDICNENCKSFKDLDSHRQSMHDIALFKMLICTKCGKGFSNTSSLQIHSKCHLPDDMRLQFSCNMCEKKFRSSSNLKFHQKMHAGMKDYVCDQCGKKFIQRANLEEHLVTHLELSTYECDLCNKFFKTSERLSKHKTRHTDEKPFACNWDGCGKTFRTKDAMNSHSRIHTGEMPFRCEFCQKPFRFRSTLLTHHNTHTGVRPYSCNDCDHQFTNWPNYNKHMKRRHGVDVSSKNPRGKKPSQAATKIYTKPKEITIKPNARKMPRKQGVLYEKTVVEQQDEDEDEDEERNLGPEYEHEVANNYN